MSIMRKAVAPYLLYCIKSVMVLGIASGFLSCAPAKKHNKQVKKTAQTQKVTNTFTVINMRDPDHNGYIEVSFAKSARLYVISGTAKPDYIAALRDSRDNKTPVIIQRASELSDTILTAVLR